MWRTTTMALGLCMVLLGGEAMVIDHVVLADSFTDKKLSEPFAAAAPYSSYGQFDTEQFASYAGGLSAGSTPRIFVPPDWAPWGLLSAGALTFLYATSLPGGKGD